MNNLGSIEWEKCIWIDVYNIYFAMYKESPSEAHLSKRELGLKIEQALGITGETKTPS